MEAFIATPLRNQWLRDRAAAADAAFNTAHAALREAGHRRQSATGDTPLIWATPETAAFNAAAEVWKTAYDRAMATVSAAARRRINDTLTDDEIEALID